MLNKIRTWRKPQHPVLTLGNVLEGCFGVFSAISLIYTATIYGWSLALVLSIIYIVVVALIAFTSAYHLA